jgi:hypothetical protein
LEMTNERCSRTVGRRRRREIKVKGEKYKVR